MGKNLRISFDDLGDRMKAYEAQTTEQRLMERIPVLARLDGRAFHTFTRNLNRPFDGDFMEAMVQTTLELVQFFQADIGYTQSDEITLFWQNNAGLEHVRDAQMPFQGRVHKWTSLLASQAAASFNRAFAVAKLGVVNVQDVGNLATFDCRVWQVPTMTEAYNAFVWRENDAVKNSVQMLAQSLYSQSELTGKKSRELHDMIHARGQNWNNYPAWAKRGTYVATVAEWKRASEQTDVPEQYRKDTVRRRVTALELPPITTFGALAFFAEMERSKTEPA